MTTKELEVQTKIDEALAKTWKPIRFDENTKCQSRNIIVEMEKLDTRVTTPKLKRDFPVIEIVDGVETPVNNPMLLEIMACIDTPNGIGAQLKEKFRLKKGGLFFYQLNIILDDYDEENGPGFNSTAEEWRKFKKTNLSREGGQILTGKQFKDKIKKI